MGGGLSTYNFRHRDYANRRSAIYLDLRRHWGAKKSLFFFFTDIGLSINGGRQPYLATISPLGAHITFETGYCYKINKKGMGPYVSLGLDGRTVNIRYKYPPPPPRSRDYGYLEFDGVMSVGFKF